MDLGSLASTAPVYGSLYRGKGTGRAVIGAPTAQMTTTDLDQILASSTAITKRHRQPHLSSFDLQRNVARLSRKGIDMNIPMQHLAELRALTGKKGVGIRTQGNRPMTHASHDFNTALQKRQESLIRDAVRQTSDNGRSHVQSISDSGFRQDWERQKQSLLHRSEIANKVQAFSAGSSSDDPIISSYLRCVSKINTDLRQGNRILLAETLYSRTPHANRPGQKLMSKEIATLWDLIHQLVDECQFPSDTFHELIQEHAPEGAVQVMTEQACAYLSNRGFVEMEQSLTQKGIVFSPDLVSKVRTYVKKIVLESIGDQHLLEHVFPRDQLPLWCLLFFSIRSGKKQAVVQFLHEALSTPEFSRDHDRLDRLKFIVEQLHDDNMNLQAGAILKRNDLAELLRSVVEDYHLLPQTDPFQVAVYLSVACCESYNHIRFRREDRQHKQVFSDLIHPSIEDYLWFKLKLVREDPPMETIASIAEFPSIALGSPDFTIESLQQVLRKYAQMGHLDSSTYPAQYLQVLLLSQQFMEAFQFLKSVDMGLAIHFGLVMRVFGLLSSAQMSSVYALLDVFAHTLAPMQAFYYIDTFAYVDERDAASSDRQMKYLEDLLARVILQCGPSCFDELLGSQGVANVSFPDLSLRVAALSRAHGSVQSALTVFMHYAPTQEGMGQAAKIIADELVRFLEGSLAHLHSINEIKSVSATDQFGLREEVSEFFNLLHSQSMQLGESEKRKLQFLWQFLEFVDHMCSNHLERAVSLVEHDGLSPDTRFFNADPALKRIFGYICDVSLCILHSSRHELKSSTPRSQWGTRLESLEQSIARWTAMQRDLF